jgi:hypothetical protein
MRTATGLLLLLVLLATPATAQLPRTLSYQGVLCDTLGAAKPDGTYTITFRLYDVSSGGSALWTEQKTLLLKRGLFSTTLGDQVVIDPSIKFDKPYWLSIQVASNPELSPRTALTAVGYALNAQRSDTAKYALSAPLQGTVDSARVAGTVPDGSITSGKISLPLLLSGSYQPLIYLTYNGPSVALGVNGTGLGISCTSTNNGAIRGWSYSNVGVYGVSGITNFAPVQDVGVLGECSNGTGVRGIGRTGVFGKDTINGNYGTLGTADDGVHGYSKYGYGTAGVSDSGVGVFGTTKNVNGVGGLFGNSYGTALFAIGSGYERANATVRVQNIFPAGTAAYFTNSSTIHTAHYYNAGTGGVLYLQNGGDASGTGGDDFITAADKAEDDVQFRVLSTGEVRSDVGFNTPAADFAEMLPAVDGLEAGDVLVIGDDGTLILSTEPYQTTVAGVYSTQPGFTGGLPVRGKIVRTIPLAMTGIVPAKVTAENGNITPGDLLATSSIPGYAMKACINPPQGSVIGKALEKLSGGIGTIRILAVLQ